MKKEKIYIQRNGLWEYYIFDCPLWNARIEKYNIKKNENYKLNCNIDEEEYNMIYFEDDNDDDKKFLFNDLYNYELEEQTKEVIYKAINE